MRSSVGRVSRVVGVRAWGGGEEVSWEIWGMGGKG